MQSSESIPSSASTIGESLWRRLAGQWRKWRDSNRRSRVPLPPPPTRMSRGGTATARHRPLLPLPHLHGPAVAATSQVMLAPPSSDTGKRSRSMFAWFLEDLGFEAGPRGGVSFRAAIWQAKQKGGRGGRRVQVIASSCNLQWTPRYRVGTQKLQIDSYTTLLAHMTLLHQRRPCPTYPPPHSIAHLLQVVHNSR